MKLTPEAQAIWDRTFQALRKLHVRHVHFEARPRYTCGSGALVDEDVCCQCAADEVRFRDMDLEGVHGEDRKVRAEKLGLSWICYARWEKGKKVFRYDLITGETIQEPKRLEYDEVRDLFHMRKQVETFGDTALTPRQKDDMKHLEFRASIHRQDIKL